MFHKQGVGKPRGAAGTGMVPVTCSAQERDRRGIQAFEEKYKTHIPKGPKSTKQICCHLEIRVSRVEAGGSGDLPVGT